MRDPKRILSKLLGDSVKADQLEATGEPLELVAEVLRDVVKFRKTRNWLFQSYKIDLAISPETFDQLLEIPQINFIETPNRNLEMEVVSLKETRNPGDSVTVGNLNVVFRELYRTLHEINEARKKNYPHLLLAKEISIEQFRKASDQITALRKIQNKPAGFLFSAWKKKSIEKEFQKLFPNSGKAHPLGKTLGQVEHELEFYAICKTEEKKWKPIGLDIFRLLREDALPQALENIEELGTQLWNIVYKHPKVQQSIEIAGIQFSDVGPLFDEVRVP